MFKAIVLKEDCCGGCHLLFKKTTFKKINTMCSRCLIVKLKIVNGYENYASRALKSVGKA
jgi:hypothetical protein